MEEAIIHEQNHILPKECRIKQQGKKKKKKKKKKVVVLTGGDGVGHHGQTSGENSAPIQVLIHRHSNSHSITVFRGCTRRTSAQESCLHRPPRLEYVGSWNGLVCLNICTMRVDMVLWNPTTSEFCFAPPPLNIASDYDGVVYGFGYDSMSDDYKSVRIAVSINGRAKAEVLSWRERSWTKLTDETQSCLYDRTDGIQARPMTSKGRANWIVYTSSDFAMLLSFKLGQEKFEWITPPSLDYDGGMFRRTIGVWKGSLAAFDNKGSSTTLWLFDDDEGRDRSCCWSKLFTVQPDSLPGWMSKPEDIWRIPGDACISFLVYRYDDRLALASIIREFNSGKHDHLIHTRSVFEFEKTLVSVPGSNSDS
ncbi:F-box protein CPR1 [Linum grandiflorum]